MPFLLFFSKFLTALIPSGRDAFPRPRKFAVILAVILSMFSFTSEPLPYINLTSGLKRIDTYRKNPDFSRIFINPDQKHIIPTRDIQRETASLSETAKELLIFSKLPVKSPQTNEKKSMTETVFDSITSPFIFYSR